MRASLQATPAWRSRTGGSKSSARGMSVSTSVASSVRNVMREGMTRRVNEELTWEWEGSAFLISHSRAIRRDSLLISHSLWIRP